jgi:hypothetical protein
MSDRDIEYYTRRAAQERRRADAATDAAARHSHMTMAARYEALRDGAPVELGIVDRG